MGIEAPNYNVSAGVSAGFVKNDGSGNFTFGELGGSGGGGIGTGWELVERKVIASDTTSITFSGLDGDTDEQYMLMAHETPPVSAGADYLITLRPNGATTLQQTFYISSPSSSGLRFATNFLDIRWRGTYQRAIGIVIDSTIWISAKSGDIRVMKAFTGGAGNNPAQSFPTGLGLEMTTSRWRDTVANITSLDIVASTAGGIGAGSTYCLYKKSAENGSVNGLELIETKLITTATGGLTFSGLDGDVDKCYKLIWNATAPSSGSLPQYLIIQPNGQVAGAAGSVHDTLFINETVGGVQRFQFPSLRFATIGLSPRVLGGELTFFAETGRTRIYMSQLNSSNSSPPSPLTRTGNQHWHGSWSDGASNTTNITSLVLTALNGNPVAFTVGSRFSLYRVKS